MSRQPIECYSADLETGATHTEILLTEQILRVVNGVLEVVQITGPVTSSGRVFPAQEEVTARYKLEAI